MSETDDYTAERIAALVRTALLDSPPEESFDRITALLARIIKVPVSIVSLVDERRQFFKSHWGLPEPWATRRETPLSHSFCQYVVSCNEPLEVVDARQHPVVKGNAAISDLGVIAYLGYPIVVEGKFPIGSLAAIDVQPREWSQADHETLKDFAVIVSSEIDLRTRIAGEGGYLEELQESREQLERILDSTGEGIYGIDPGGCCTFSNQSCLQLLGYDSPDELLGKQMHELIHHTRPDGSPYPTEECRIHVAAIKGQPAHVEDEFLWRKDGTSFAAEYRSYPISRNGQRYGAVVTFTDISGRLRARQELIDARERAEESDRQKTQFLANMSHEIRTPMNAILGFSELMESVVVSKKAKEYLAVIRDSGRSLLELINDILDLSKIEAGRIELNIEPVDLNELVQSVVALIAPDATGKGLELSVDVAAELPKCLLLDRLRVRQILLNLLSNAVKFTRAGSIAVKVCAEAATRDGQRMDLILAVSDTGVGISKLQQKRIFKAFHQVSSTDESGLSGTGLGLSISKRLAKLMDGEITVSSTPGKGSTFTVTLQNVEAALEEVSPHSAVLENEQDLDLIRASRILVVDDNEVNRRLISEIFDGSHHEILLAEDGEQAIEIAHREKPDLVLMDIRMPRLDGRKALQILRSDAELPELPVVAVTASSLLNKEKALRKAFDGYLRKPFSKAQLFRELARRLPLVEPNAGSGEAGDGPDVLASGLAPGEVATVPDGRIDDWKRLADELHELEQSSWQTVSQTLAIQTVIEFARNLKRLAAANDCAFLGEYADSLHTRAEHFKLAALERQLTGFPELIVALRNAVEAAVSPAE